MHQPVLLTETIEALLSSHDGSYLDATFGRGGHTLGLLERLGACATVFVCDRDQLAIDAAKKILDPRLKAYCCNYSDVFQELETNSLDGILADFGLCSAQLDNPERGFSFQHNGPLDMRMSLNEPITLMDFLGKVSEKELANILYEYGEEKLSRKIASLILERKREGKCSTTKELAACATEVYPKGGLTKHPATRTFQALRIALNQELDHLSIFLNKSASYLKNGGRLTLITFHSLEYTKVKEILNHQYDEMKHGIRSVAMKKVTHPLFPSSQECSKNPRSRSARLHIYEKVSSK
jgi:16S rRNA (cytosine1402-N4)-methyltransferase